MDPFVVKTIIDKNIKNLHPDLESLVIDLVVNSGIKSKKKVIKFIREKLSIPKIGSDKRNYWIKRGWSEKECEEKRIRKKMPSSPMKIENWTCKVNPDTGSNYTIEEAIIKIKSFRKFNKEYWMSRGMSESESIREVARFQKENSEKFLQKMIDNPNDYLSRTSTQIGYYLKRGFSQEESHKMLKDRQSTLSIDRMIKIYGEEVGTIKYLNRIDRLKYTSSRKFYIDKYGEVDGNKKYDEMLLKRIVPMSKSSKQSFRFFLPIYKFLRKNDISKEDIYWGVGHSNEWFINIDGNLFFYDFTIRSLKVIIEFHGEKFHPRSIDDGWKNIYNKEISIEHQFNRDKIKEKSAKKSGFDYHVVFSNDDLESKQKELIEIISKKCQ